MRQLDLPQQSFSEALLHEGRARRHTPRLLMLVPWLTTGGADKFNLDLLAQLTRRGWQVTLVTTLQGDHAWLPAFSHVTSDIVVLHQAAPIRRYPQVLRDLILSRRVEIVLIANSELGYCLLPYLRMACPDVALVSFCHMEEEAWKKGGYPRMAVEGQQWLDLSVVSSDYLKRWMVERGANPARTRVCYTNVDPDQWCPNEEQRVAIRQELAIDETVPILLYTGRICAQKQPRIFARVMLRLTQRAVPYAALVAGDGPDLGWLRTFIRKEGLRDRVHLLGVVTSARIRQLLAAADVFFLPSQWEGIALAIYEAMACGVPVVGADVGGQRELVTPECGRLIARGDEESEVEHYSEALVMLLANPSLRRRMGETSRRRVSEHFHLDQMGDRMAALLREAVCLHEAQPRSMPDFATGRAHAIRTVRYMQVCAILRRVTALPYLNRYKKWLFPFKETLERVLLR